MVLWNFFFYAQNVLYQRPMQSHTVAPRCSSYFYSPHLLFMFVFCCCWLKLKVWPHTTTVKCINKKGKSFFFKGDFFASFFFPKVFDFISAEMKAVEIALTKSRTHCEWWCLLTTSKVFCCWCARACVHSAEFDHFVCKKKGVSCIDCTNWCKDWGIIWKKMLKNPCNVFDFVLFFLSWSSCSGKWRIYFFVCLVRVFSRVKFPKKEHYDTPKELISFLPHTDTIFIKKNKACDTMVCFFFQKQCAWIFFLTVFLTHVVAFRQNWQIQIQKKNGGVLVATGVRNVLSPFIETPSPPCPRFFFSFLLKEVCSFIFPQQTNLSFSQKVITWPCNVRHFLVAFCLLISSNYT